MRNAHILILIAVLASALPAGASNSRMLTAEVEMADLTAVQLEAGVGDVEITVTDGSLVVASVELRPRRGGIFSSLKAAEKQVQAVTFEPTVKGKTLVLTLEGIDEDRRFEEDWTISVPSPMAMIVELGVGDLEMTNASGGLDLELGVGDAAVHANGGPIEIEVGVGDITVRGQASAFRTVEASAGVGDVRIVAQGQKIAGEGFIAHSAEWSGPGNDDLEAESGVGDIRIILE